MVSAILLQTQKESQRNLQPFTGDLSQNVDESISDYYNVTCRLCHHVDPNMSKQMILRFLQERYSR
jgi:hypothetical protein